MELYFKEKAIEPAEGRARMLIQNFSFWPPTPFLSVRALLHTCEKCCNNQREVYFRPENQAINMSDSPKERPQHLRGQRKIVVSPVPQWGLQRRGRNCILSDSFKQLLTSQTNESLKSCWWILSCYFLATSWLGLIYETFCSSMQAIFTQSSSCSKQVMGMLFRFACLLT